VKLKETVSNIHKSERKGNYLNKTELKMRKTRNNNQTARNNDAIQV
jgi:hypothetical protein